MDHRERMITEQGPWLDVDLGGIQRNARRYAGMVGVRLLPMVKANAYGLGAIPVVRALEPLGPWGYGVATIEEGRAIRQAGIDRPILAFWPFTPDATDGYLAADLRPAIGDLEALRAWTVATDRPFHLAVDTGMGRGGLQWHDESAVEAFRDALRHAPGYEGVFTHFHSSDASWEATELQWTRFQEVIAALGGRPPLVHAANSAAAQWGDRYAGNLARTGIFLYGGRAGPLGPEPVATLSGRVLAVRSIRAGDPVSYGATWSATEPCEVATLGVGYADGLHRALAGRGQVWLGDRAWPIAGRITMDMTMVALPCGTARVGDQAIVFGRPLPLDQQAERAGTIAYELLTAVGPRVVRRYGGSS